MLRQVQPPKVITPTGIANLQTIEGVTAELIPENPNQQRTLALETLPLEKAEIKELANQMLINDKIREEKQQENQPSMAVLSEFIQKELRQLASLLNLTEWELTAWLATTALVPSHIQL